MMSIKLLTVAHQEIWYHLRQWTFYMTILVMPVVFAAVGALPRLRDVAQEAPLPPVETILNAPSTEIDVHIGFVDYAGFVETLPDQETGGLIPFVDETAAVKALQAGEIESFYIISADYLRSGEVRQVSGNPQLLADTDVAIRAVLRDNLLQSLNDPLLAARLDRPVRLIRHGPPPPVVSFIPAELNMGQLFSAGLVVLLFVYVINFGGNLLLRAIQREVRARVLEVVIASTTPVQFIGGKLVGLTTLTLFQVGFTLLAAGLVYGRNPDGSGPSELPVDALLLSAPYLVLGFLSYSGGIMSIAAMWPDFRESGALLAVLRLLTLAPLLGVLFILPNPDGPVAVWLSLMPITSHLLMPFRLLLTDVPGWQWTLGVIILLLWTSLWIWLSMRLFRAHSLLTGRSVDAKLMWQALWR
jgi:ABC-2 type transport system permease protein